MASLEDLRALLDVVTATIDIHERRLARLEQSHSQPLSVIAAESKVQRLERELAAVIVERDQARVSSRRSLLSDYACTVCGARMKSWAECEEYQHVDCGGLVELAEVTRARKVTVQQVAVWLEQRAQAILAGSGNSSDAQHRAAGLTDAVDSLRAGTWKANANG